MKHKHQLSKPGQRIGIIVYLILSFAIGKAQQNIHPQSTQYEWPTDVKVKAKLDKWQDQKFGMIIHWG